MQNELQFRTTLRHSTRIALLTKKISIEDWVLIQSSLLNPVRTNDDGQQVDLVEEMATESLALIQTDTKQATADHTIESINWGGLANVIVKNLPTIIQLVKSIIEVFPK